LAAGAALGRIKDRTSQQKHEKKIGGVSVLPDFRDFVIFVRES
jgi:hypothetical protein